MTVKKSAKQVKAINTGPLFRLMRATRKWLNELATALGSRMRSRLERTPGMGSETGRVQAENEPFARLWRSSFSSTAEERVGRAI